MRYNYHQLASLLNDEANAMDVLCILAAMGIGVPAGDDKPALYEKHANIAYRTDKGVVRAGKEAAGRFATVLTDLLVFVGGDLAKLEPRYSVRAPSREKDGALNVIAEPRADDVKKLVRVVRFQTTPDLWAVRRIEIEEAGGDRSLIEFGPAQRDPKVDPATMRPPA